MFRKVSAATLLLVVIGLLVWAFRSSSDSGAPAQMVTARNGDLVERHTESPVTERTVPQADLTDLSVGEIELKERFNRDVGHVRMLLILSPT